MNGASRTRALVIGAAGQDGSYLSELLLEKGYEVTAVVREEDGVELPNLAAVREKLSLVRADLVDTPALDHALREYRPQEVYNFAGVSFGPDAWTYPGRMAELGTGAVARLLEALLAYDPAVRFFQASSSWIFGRPDTAPQNEATPYRPAEPYGAAKAYTNFLLQAFRKHHGSYVCSGIFFNHESPRRPPQFVTRKITHAAASIKLGLQDELVLGSIDARRDWGYARDYVEGVWRMMQQEQADDYVLATGELHSVEQFIEKAFARLGLNWRDHVRYGDAELTRVGSQVIDLVGNASRARDELDWQRTVDFDGLVNLMVDADLVSLQAANA